MINLISLTLIGTGVFGVWYCAGWADAHARDDEAWRVWQDTAKSITNLIELKNPFTRYHTGNPKDRWHLIRNIERYGAFLVYTAIGMWLWNTAWIKSFTIAGWLLWLPLWQLATLVIAIITGWTGFQIGSGKRWKSRWLN